MALGLPLEAISGQTLPWAAGGPWGEQAAGLDRPGSPPALPSVSSDVQEDLQQMCSFEDARQSWAPDPFPPPAPMEGCRRARPIPELVSVQLPGEHLRSRVPPPGLLCSGGPGRRGPVQAQTLGACLLLGLGERGFLRWEGNHRQRPVGRRKASCPAGRGRLVTCHLKPRRSRDFRLRLHPGRQSLTAWERPATLQGCWRGTEGGRTALGWQPHPAQAEAPPIDSPRLTSGSPGSCLCTAWFSSPV